LSSSFNQQEEFKMPTIEADVLIVAVTDVEKDAVLNAFHKATNTLPQAVNIGDRTYQNLGIINGSTVYINSSDSFTQRLLRNYKSPDNGERI
jgi:hypothetical protein